jgi:hypothetical protein
MERRIVSPTGPPSPLWVPVHGDKPLDWMERVAAHTCYAGAHELLVGLELLRVDDARARYLRGSLTVLQKLGATVTRWLDVLDHSEDRADDEPWRRSFADEQSARQRLAWELLLELVGFSNTDSLLYYSHHYDLLRLRYFASRRADLSAFFDCQPHSLAASLKKVAEEVITAEKEPAFDLTQAWYAIRRTPTRVEKLARTSPARLLSSQRSRLKELAPLMKPTERVALGLSYHRLYSRLSRSVHFSMQSEEEHIGEPDSVRGHGDGDVALNDLRWGALVVARLGVLSLRRLLSLTGIEGGAACTLQREVMASETTDPHAEMFTSLVDGNVRIGDFALVGGRYLTEVLERTSNSLGYFRYHVLYIAERPQPEIEQEWQPATDVHTLWGREKVEGWLAEQLATATAADRAVAARWDQAALLRSYVKIIWEEQLRDEVLTMLRDSGPVAYT